MMLFFHNIQTSETHKIKNMAFLATLLGMGNFLAYSGCYIWVLEFVPENSRIFYNTYSALIYAVGYPGIVCISYFIHDWNYIHLAAAIIIGFCYVPMLLLPDSPR